MDAITSLAISTVAKGVTSICDSCSRIVESNNWRDTELAACRHYLKACRNRIEKLKKDRINAIDFYYDIAADVINSKNFTSAEKRVMYIEIMDQLSKI